MLFEHFFAILSNYRRVLSIEKSLHAAGSFLYYYKLFFHKIDYNSVFDVHIFGFYGKESVLFD